MAQRNSGYFPNQMEQQQQQPLSQLQQNDFQGQTQNQIQSSQATGTVNNAYHHAYNNYHDTDVNGYGANHYQTTRDNTLANSNSSYQPENTINNVDYSTNNNNNTVLNQQQQPQPQRDPLSPTRSGRFTEEWGAGQRGQSLLMDERYTNVSNSRPQSFVVGDDDGTLKRGNTLKKKASLRRTGSLKRSSSRRSSRAGSVRSLALHSNSDPDEARNIFHCPVPTSGNPTEVLANRFQGWRKILKDLIIYFREVQTFYEARQKALTKISNVANNISTPPGFLTSGGLEDAMRFIGGHNKAALLEAQKAREIQQEVILALTGLRSDLQQKIKEIKNLSGDFKNSVEKETEVTRRAVRALQDVLGQNEVDTSLTVGKQDPYLLRLAVDRQVDRQLDEENYLHQAYLNLENSGRELESIVVGEIQKAYNAYAGILKRDADATYAAIDGLRNGPIAMPKDQEWHAFVQQEDQFVDPKIPVRSAQYISYPGRDHVSCQEIRAGLLERKSKYLRSYTAGWYVLSPTHLHEFKSADKGQAPVMSLYLPEQKLGSHSNEGGSSNKFVLKGRQTGGLHRGHTWVFRAESRDTMLAWYEDIKILTERSPEQMTSIVRSHSRSVSQASHRSASSDGIVNDDDDEPFSASSAIDVTTVPRQDTGRRPQPGGRFPSDIQVNAQRGLQAPNSPSSLSSSGDHHDTRDRDVIAAAQALPGHTLAIDNNQWNRDSKLGYGSSDRTPMDEVPSHAAAIGQDAREQGVNPYRAGAGITAINMATATNSIDNNQLFENRTWTENGTNGQLGQQSNRLTPAHLDQQGPIGLSQESINKNPLQAESKPTDLNLGVVGVGGGVGTGNNGNGVMELEAPSAAPLQPFQHDEGDEARPTMGSRIDSTTISNLHIPGQYPKSTTNL